MSVVVDVPADVAEALESFLQMRYPELAASDEIHRSISYSHGKSPSSIYDAAVTYFHQRNSSHALFEFAEHVDKHHGRVRRWYCRNDWND